MLCIHIVNFFTSRNIQWNIAVLEYSKMIHPIWQTSIWILNFTGHSDPGLDRLKITIFSIPVPDSLTTFTPSETTEVLVLAMQTKAEEYPISNESFCVGRPILTKCWSKYIVSLTETYKKWNIWTSSFITRKLKTCLYYHCQVQMKMNSFFLSPQYSERKSLNVWIDMLIAYAHFLLTWSGIKWR